jgi:hypothetical protein
MYITLGNSTPLRDFSKLFEVLTASCDRRRVAFNSPEPLKLYTKQAIKANPAGTLR